jgi:acyl carrier protein
MQKILSIINEILEDNDRQKIESLKPEMSLRNDIGFDSMDLAKLTVMIEDQYNVDIFEKGLVDKISEVMEKIK